MTEPVPPVALVTGASSGIGRGIALELAGRGYDLIVTARRKELLESLADEVRTRFKHRVTILAADLGSKEGCEQVEAAIASGLDILIANAGFSSRGHFPVLPVNNEVALVELNVVSTLRLCHAAAVMMSRRGHGRILVTSSAASFQPLPGLASYGASKAFLTSFAQALDAELRPRGITVSCLAPGYTVKNRGAPRPRPGWLWTTSEEVARAAVEGLLDGRRLIVPGLPWKVVATLAPRLPRSVSSRIATAVGRRMVSSPTRGI